MIRELGKVPPQSEDSELAVLGIILTYPDAINDITEILSPETFYRNAHQLIFESALNVFKKIGKIDLITVSGADIALRPLNGGDEVGASEIGGDA